MFGLFKTSPKDIYINAIEEKVRKLEEAQHDETPYNFLSSKEKDLALGRASSLKASGNVTLASSRACIHNKDKEVMVQQLRNTLSFFNK